jgi:hypothetical protein
VARGVRVSWLRLKIKVDGFPDLGLKTGSCGLVIWASKSPQWFLGWDLKTKLAMVYRLHHKTDGRRMACDTCQDLAACVIESSRAMVSQFVSKLAVEWWRVMHVASSWMPREDKVKDGWVDATGYIKLFYPNFAVFIVLGPMGILVF